VVEPSAWARWKGILIENIPKNSNSNNDFFFYLGSLNMELPKKKGFFIFFKLCKLVEDYHLLLPSKPLEGDFCCL
jgi:hypothetical protein